MITAKIDITKELSNAIDKALEVELGKEFDEAIERFNKRKNEIVSGVLLRVSKSVDIRTMRESLQITIREIK